MDTQAYLEFVKSKMQIAEERGISDTGDVALHPSTFPHQRDTIRWALRQGRALVAISFGLGKARLQCEIAHPAARGQRSWWSVHSASTWLRTRRSAPGCAGSVRTDDEVASTPYLITNYSACGTAISIRAARLLWRVSTRICAAQPG
jgi:hypothetical protein